MNLKPILCNFKKGDILIYSRPIDGFGFIEGTLYKVLKVYSDRLLVKPISENLKIRPGGPYIISRSVFGFDLFKRDGVVSDDAYLNSL